MSAQDKRTVLFGYVKPFLALNLYPGTRIVDRAATELAFKVAEIEPRFRRHFARTHFLISKRVRRFLKQLEAVRNQLSRSTWTEEEVTLGVIRGPVNWGKTMSARMAVGHASFPLFVTRPRHRTFDTPENQLLVYILRRLSEVIEEVDTSGPPQAILEPDSPGEGTLLSHLSWAGQEIRTTLSMVQLKAVRIPMHVDGKLLAHVATSRDDFYASMPDFYEYCEQMGIEGDAPAVEMDAIDSLLTYANTERLLELAVLFKVVGVLNDKLEPLGGVRTWQPLMGRSEYAAVWQLPNGTLSVSLQKMPDFVVSSLYKTLLTETGLRPSRTTPDIVITWRHVGTSQDRWVHFVEVKDNQPNESPFAMDYFRDSLYKVMGYSKDFAGSYAASGLPHVTLVVWRGLPKSATIGDIWVTQFDADAVWATLGDRILTKIGGAAVASD